MKPQVLPRTPSPTLLFGKRGCSKGRWWPGHDSTRVGDAVVQLVLSPPVLYSTQFYLSYVLGNVSDIDHISCRFTDSPCRTYAVDHASRHLDFVYYYLYYDIMNALLCRANRTNRPTDPTSLTLTHHRPRSTTFPMRIEPRDQRDGIHAHWVSP